MQGEKAVLERSFEQQLRKLKDEQEKELLDLQERLREEQRKETDLLQQQQSSQLKQLSSQHRQQVACFFLPTHVKAPSRRHHLIKKYDLSGGGDEREP